MRFVQAYYDIYEQLFITNNEIPTHSQIIEHMYEHIEKCARTCYKSEDKITPGSASSFVRRMILSKHYAMLEFGTIYLKIPDIALGFKYLNTTRTWTKCNFIDENGEKYWAVTTNFRVIIENNWEDDLVFLCAPTEHHEKRRTIKFTCDIGVGREFLRHRV